MEPETIVRTREELQAILGEPGESQAGKRIHYIDKHCRAWIERCPFIVISSCDSLGAMDVSPKGDPPGFVRVVDEQTLVIPDRPGNRRADTFLNILDNPKIAMIFIIPRRGETLRVSGEARIVRESPILETMSVQGKVPQLAIVVDVKEAMFHCGKSMIRSKLWKPEEWPPIEGLPTYAMALVDHANLSRTVDEMQEAVTRNEQRIY